MNKVAKALIVIGVIDIIAGFIIGFSTYKTEVPGLYRYITEENYSLLFMWIIAGIVSGVMMFGFAEIIRLLEESRDITKEQLNVLKDFHYQFKLQNENQIKEDTAKIIADKQDEDEKKRRADELRKSVMNKKFIDFGEMRNELHD